MFHFSNIFDNFCILKACNPVAKSNTIPDDSIMILYFIPLIGASFFRGYKFVNLVICFFIAIVSIAIAESIVGGYLHVHTVCYGLVVLMCTHELERMARISFLSYKKEKLGIIARHNQDRADKDVVQLKCLMG